MIFNPRMGGHNVTYIIHFLRYWCSHKLPANLWLVVSPKFMEDYPEVIAELGDDDAGLVTWSPITGDELDWYESQNAFGRIRAEWQLFCRYAKKFSIDHGHIMNFDAFTIPLFLRLPLPCDLSGIYFRPSLHYRDFAWYRPTPTELLKNAAKTLMLKGWIRHPRLKGIFSLDPLAVSHLQQHLDGNRVFYLPDPVKIYVEMGRKAEDLRLELGIEPGRRVFLMFGVLNEVKGIFQLLEAFKLLSRDTGEKACLLLIGPGKCEDRLMRQVQTTLDTAPVQIIRRNQFITDRQVQPYFEVADVVVTPYQRHIGMSSVIVRAAAAGKPVLSSDYGLVGEVVRRHRLGLTLDATNPKAIAGGLMACIFGNLETIFEAQAAQQFARENDAAKYAQVLCENLLTL